MSFNVPLVIRGKVIDHCNVEFGARRTGRDFFAPDAAAYASEMTLSAPSRMRDLYDLVFDDLVDYLVELGQRLPLSRNAFIQQAFEVSCQTSGLAEPILRVQYENLPHVMFEREELRNVARRSVGIEYLEGWVEQPPGMGGISARCRAFGARCVHIIAGNSPIVAYMTVIRNALTRSDCIIKAPSNDPLTAVAIARTMVEMAPDHPLTKHTVAGYWKGGDARVEEAIYDPRKIEKIIAWGGLASVRHITQYLQPGIDLITQDPKLSGTIIGKEAFADEPTVRQVARRLALDIGAANQEGCVSARVVYVESGTDAGGLRRLNELGALTFAALQNLPSSISTPHPAFSDELKEEIEAIRLMSDEFEIFGGRSNEGAIIVSQEDEPVDFSRMLACRVANLVPVDDIETAVKSVNAYTQTIGIYPESLKLQLRDRLAYQGGQRLVSLGGAATGQHSFERQDAIESVRRMVKWVVEESVDGERLAAMAV
jgi:Acyl-CoA reductase (LuxC)